jgi:poly(A) polymerase
MIMLPPGAWREDTALLAILDALGGSAMTRAVGGAVRDSLLGQPVSDVDLATRLVPEDVVARLAAAGLKSAPTGIAHGTVTAIAGGRGFEVTTLRRDVATDGRRATIAFTDDWAEDAARRDFTINALYADPQSGEIFDPVGGLADLDARRVLFIGDAAARIDEDHLRILRWFRFLGRFGIAAPDEATFETVAGRAAKLRGLSRERVADELMRILALPDPASVVRLMDKAGVLAEILPEAVNGGVDRLEALVRGEGAADVAGDAGRRLAALVAGDALAADKAAARLKLSNRLRKRLHVALSDDAGRDARALAYRIGIEGATDRLLLAGEPERLADLDGWDVPRLPFSGGDLVALGVTAGPEVARLLRRLEDQWISEGFPTAIDLRQWLDAGQRD